MTSAKMSSAGSSVGLSAESDTVDVSPPPPAFTVAPSRVS
jgi:hypothetical protein